MNQNCGSINTYVGCRWKSIELHYTSDCKTLPDCSSYNSLLNITNCFYEYLNSWNYSANNHLQSSSYLLNLFYTHAIAGSDTFGKACDRYNAFYKCIGGTEDAFNTFDFAQVLTFNKNNDTANDWISIFQQQNFVCSNGVDGEFVLIIKVNESFLGLKETMECDAKTDTCYSHEDTCENLVIRNECINQLINYKCGKTAAYYQCSLYNFNLKYSSSCKNTTLDCNQFSSGSIVGIGITLMFSLLIGFFN